MNFFETIIINIILLLFPLMVYLFYAMYSQNISTKKKKIFLDFAFFSSLYLLVSFNKHNEFIILLNIPLLISYLKKHDITSIFISLAIIIYYNYIGYEYNSILIINYILFYLLYIFFDRKRKSEQFFINNFIIIESLFLYECFIFYQEFTFFNFHKTNISIVMFIVVAHVMTYIFNKGEDVICLHVNIKELERDKQFRTSLFKITHEIKNPIAVCKSYLDMFDFNNPEHEKYIPIVKEETNKILLLLQDFLSMNKIKIEKDLLDINLLLEETSFQLEPVLKKNKAIFDCELIDDEIFIEGDYNRLSQVLINVIKNALEANSTEIKLNTEITEKEIIITIEDNGDGISKKDLEKISEPFYTTKKNGTGLGVSLSCEIISAHDGTILYTSEEGRGTKVTITLPLSNYE